MSARVLRFSDYAVKQGQFSLLLCELSGRGPQTKKKHQQKTNTNKTTKQNKQTKNNNTKKNNNNLGSLVMDEDLSRYIL